MEHSQLVSFLTFSLHSIPILACLLLWVFWTLFVMSSVAFLSLLLHVIMGHGFFYDSKSHSMRMLAPVSQVLAMTLNTESWRLAPFQHILTLCANKWKELQPWTKSSEQHLQVQKVLQHVGIWCILLCRHRFSKLHLIFSLLPNSKPDLGTVDL